MNGLSKAYRLSFFGLVALAGTFVLGLLRALADDGKIDAQMSTPLLVMHIALALVTGLLSLYLFHLSKKTGLIFPEALATANLSAVALAGASGLLFLFFRVQFLTYLMLSSFEVSFGLSSVLVGYLYSFFRNCYR
ncbi:MAG: hypothetical protein MPF33_02545 [Candidatus Aramenus sp.]|nr:hypothetical protein [Candidatus Aramenus sp.]